MAIDTKITDTLPDKPSELLRTALADLDAVLLADKAVVNMQTWYTPKLDKLPCTVCLAGAVMLQRYESHLPAHDPLNAENWPFGGSLHYKFQALDSFRRGWINPGLMSLGVSRMDIPGDLPARIPVSGHLEAWRADMDRIVQLLENAKL